MIVLKPCYNFSKFPSCAYCLMHRDKKTNGIQVHFRAKHLKLLIYEKCKLNSSKLTKRQSFRIVQKMLTQVQEGRKVYQSMEI